MQVYGTEFTVDHKDDQSPLTEADRRAHNVIVAGLTRLDSKIPVLSEESPPQVMTERLEWERYWLVDPLDGTKEFVKRNGEFTVNIALIEDHRAVLGAVHAPVLGTDYFGALQHGAWTRRSGGPQESIRVQTPVRKVPVVVGSRSHRGQSLDRMLERLGPHELMAMGSSLKICLVASGEADFYPRLGPTSEWDTAAAQAVLESAGGFMLDVNGDPLRYNKADILNPHFLAFGDDAVNWLGLGDA
jgi:3'(2'), 5'-bisphosphate nucleotidase